MTQVGSGRRAVLAAAQKCAGAPRAEAVSRDLPPHADIHGCYCHSHQGVTDFYARCQVVK